MNLLVLTSQAQMLRPSPLVLSVFLAALVCVTTARSQGTPVHADSVQRAREYFINGTTLQLQGNRHAEAILEFQEALAYDSSSVTLAAIARSYLELHKLDRAENYARLALKGDSTLRDAWELLAEILVSSGKYDEGVEAYEHVRALGPSRRQLYTLGRLYEPRNADKAIEVYEELVAKDPDIGIYQRLSSLYERKRNVNGQISSLERAAAVDPLNVSVAVELVDVYIANGRLEDASAIARSWAATQRRSDGGVRVWGSLLSSLLADSLVANLYLDQTQLLLDQAMREYAWSVPIVTLVGSVALTVKDVNRAIVAFDVAAELVQQRAEPLLQIGAVYLTTGYPQEAISFLQHWQPKYARDPRFLVMIADCYTVLPDERQAVTYYRASLDIDPMIIEAWMQLGGLYDVLGEQDSSDAAYENVLALDPLNMVANNNLSYSLAVRGIRLERARDLAWTALQQNPRNAAYLDTYAWVLFRLGHLDRARSYIEQAIVHGGNATHFAHLGDILEGLGDIDGAIRAWEEALALDPELLDLKTKIDRYR